MTVAESISSCVPSEKLTQKIRIRVVPDYSNEHSRPSDNQYVFCYRVCIHNEGDHSVRLLSRHWIIIDADGKREDPRTSYDGFSRPRKYSHHNMPFPDVRAPVCAPLLHLPIFSPVLSRRRPDHLSTIPARAPGLS